MKNVKTAILATLISLSLASCASTEQQHSLPETLLIECETDFETPDLLNSYELSYIDIEQDLLNQHLLKNEIVEVIEYKDVIATYCENNEYLMDFTSETVNKGGFSYGNGNLSSDLANVYSANIDYGNNSISRDALLLYDRTIKYQQKSDLWFDTYADTEQEFLSLIDNLGVGDVEIWYSFSMDSETMTENEQENNEYLIEYNDPEYSVINDTVYDKNHEAYIFLGRQMIDSIPVSQYVWSDNSTDQSTLFAMYSKDGLVDMRLSLCFDIGNSLGEEEIISSSEALDVFIKDYNKSLHTDNTTIYNMELNYIKLQDKNENMIAVPAYIFSTSTPTDSEDTPFSTNYFTNVVNAVTGEIIKTDWIED